MNKSRIARGLKTNHAAMRRLGHFRVTKLIPAPSDELSLLGLQALPVESEAILPRAIGKHARFNVNGREKIQREIPMEQRSISYILQKTDRYGVLRQRDITRRTKMRQRRHVPAPYEYLEVSSLDGALLVSSRVLSLESESQELILHIVNMFRELFNSYAITAADDQRASSVPLRKRHWKIVLDKQYSYEEARAILDQILILLPDRHRNAIERRVAIISEHRPDFLAVGQGGFSDYFVFGFTSIAKYLFESTNLGNATYIFRDDWKHLDQLTKKQIRDDDLQHARIVHDGAWEVQLRMAIQS